MKKGITRGARIFIILSLVGLVLGLAGLFEGTRSYDKQLADYEQRGRIYDPEASEEKSSYVLRILELKETNIEIDSGRLYIVRYQRQADWSDYVLLLSDPQNPTLKQLIQAQAQGLPLVGTILAERMPEYDWFGRGSSRRQFHYVTARLEADAHQEFARLFPNMTDYTFVTDHYLSLDAYQNTKTSVTWFAAGFTVAGVLFLLAAYYRIKKNRRYYVFLEQKFPEIKNNYQILSEQASYHDSAWRLLVYKDFLVSYAGGFFATALSELKSIDFIENTVQIKNSSRQVYCFRVHYVNPEQGADEIDLSDQEPYERREVFYTFLEEAFPHIDRNE